MNRTLNCELTNMCLIENNNGEILLQLRTKKDWPGYTLPGGHVEKGEDLVSSIIREVKEETNLDIKDPVLKGIMEYKCDKGQDMYLVFIYKATSFSNTLKDSKEGHLAFKKISEIKKEEWSSDMEEILKIIYDEKITDISYIKTDTGEYKIILR